MQPLNTSIEVLGITTEICELPRHRRGVDVMDTLPSFTAYSVTPLRKYGVRKSGPTFWFHYSRNKGDLVYSEGGVRRLFERHPALAVTILETIRENEEKKHG